MRTLRARCPTARWSPTMTSSLISEPRPKVLLAGSICKRQKALLVPLTFRRPKATCLTRQSLRRIFHAQDLTCQEAQKVSIYHHRHQLVKYLLLIFPKWAEACKSSPPSQRRTKVRAACSYSHPQLPKQVRPWLREPVWVPTRTSKTKT